jgi:chromosome segregation ATPase
MNESIETLHERVRSLERERKQLRRQIEADNEELTRLHAVVDKANRDVADQVREAEDRYHEYQQQINAEHTQDRVRLVEELELKSAKVEECSALIEKLSTEAPETKRSLQRFSEDNDAKGEEIQRLRARLDESDREWNARIEKEKESVRLQTEELLNSVKQKNQELRALCAKTNESMSNTEQHNRSLIQRVNGLERELEQIMQQWTNAKEELAREKQLIGPRREPLSCMLK